MIYFYLRVFDNNYSNPSFHEEQLPAIAADSGFGSGCFLTHRQAVYKWKLSRKKKNNNNNNNCYGNRNIKQFKFIVDNALLPAR